VALRENTIDIPFISSEGFTEELALGAVYEAESAEVTPITPDAGALDATGGDPTYHIGQENYPSAAALASLGQLARVSETHDHLTVLFDIISTVTVPLTILFDIETLPGASTPNPLTVTFDIIQENGTPLTVTFNILPGGLVSRRLTSDVQGPVAKAVIS